METTHLDERTRRKIAFVLLEIMFFAIAGGIALIRPVEIPLKFLPVFILAVFRLARTISFNEVAEIWREPFTEVKPDSCGAGSNVHPKGEGFQYVVGALISCPICSGQWAALGLYVLYAISQPIGLTLAFIFGIAGGSELVHWGAELLEWGGRASRVISGMISPDEE